jgi:GNAT superfamily N-acetyltransferase
MILPDGYSGVAPGKLASVVTCLHMRSRPTLRPAPSRVAWQLTHVRKSDPEWYRTLFRRVGEEWLWFSRLVMPSGELQHLLADPQVEIHAFSLDGTEEGLLELDFREAGQCELAFFGLTARARGQGAGRWLMNRALELAWSRSIDRLWVHTCTLDHPAALGFYLRSGFVAYERRVEVADDPRLTGVAAPDALPDVPIIRA